MTDTGLISFFYIWTFSFSSNNWWRSCFLFWHLCQISGGCNCLCLIFSFIFCFINLNVFSYHTMLSLLLWIFNIWILVWKFLHYYSNHTLTPWIIFYLTGIFCNSTWKLINFCLFVVIVFYFFEEYHRNFDWDCTEPVVSFHFGRMVWWFELNSFFKKKSWSWCLFITTEHWLRQNMVAGVGYCCYRSDHAACWENVNFQLCIRKTVEYFKWYLMGHRTILVI